MGSISNDLKEFQKFMKQVDNVHNIVGDMVSGDADTELNAMKKADNVLKKADPNKNIGFDRTVINKKAFKDDPQQTALQQPETDQSSFMAAMEADANRRAAARRERYKKADQIKLEGNACFKDGNFKKALKCYSEAIEVARDSFSLYTNRAAAHLKLENFDKAISDCNFSIELNEKWVKSYYLKAKAYKMKNKLKKSEQVILKMLEYDESKDQLVKSFIKDLHHERDVRNQEKEANKSDSKKIDEVIKSIREKTFKLDTENEDTCFYTIGLQLLETLCVDEKSKTLFRTNRGFELVLDDVLLIKQCLESKYDSDNSFVLELVVSGFKLFRSACKNLRQNLKYLFQNSTFQKVFHKVIKDGHIRVKKEIVSLLYDASLQEDMRNVLYEHIKGVDNLCLFLISENVIKFELALLTFHNFTLDEKFTNKVIPLLISSPVILDQLASILKNQTESTKAIQTCLKILNTFCKNKKGLKEVSKHVLTQNVIIELLLNLLKKKDESTFILASQLAMFMISNGWSCSKNAELIISNFTTCICDADISSKLKTEILKVVNVVLRKNLELSNYFDNNEKIFEKMFDLVKLYIPNEPGLRSISLKIVCIVCKQIPDKLFSLYCFDKKLQFVEEILFLDSNGLNTMDQGHIACLLGDMTKHASATKMLSYFVSSDVVCSKLIRRLLVLCRDLKDEASRINCTTTLAKLAKTHPKFLDHLRQNDGINILSRLNPKDL